MNILLHIGPHKTATTSLQAILLRSESSLSNNGILYLGAHSSRSEVYLQWRTRYMKTLVRLVYCILESKHHMIAPLSHDLTDQFTLLRALATPAESVIISDENILGPMVGHTTGQFLCKGFYPAYDIIFSSISRAFCHDYTKVCVVRRPLSSWLISVYKDMVAKILGNIEPERFLLNVPSTLQHDENLFYKSFSTAFGNRGVVYDYKGLVDTHFESILQLISDYFHVPAISATPLHINSSLNLAQIEFILRVYDLLDTPGSRREMLKYVRNHFSASQPTPDFSLRFDEFQRCLNERFPS